MLAFATEVGPKRRSARPAGDSDGVIKPDEIGALPIEPQADGHPKEMMAADDDVDPFAGVFALAMFLCVMVVLFIAQLVAASRVVTPPPTIEVSLVAPPEASTPPQPRVAAPPPPPVPLRAQESAPLGKSADPIAAPLDSPAAAARAATGAPGTPSENRLLNEPPRPRGSPTPVAGGSSAAAPASDILRLAPSEATERAARSAALDSTPAGRQQDATAPAAPGPPQTGAARAGGEGVIMAAGVIRGFRPEYPLAARQRGLEGNVLLRVHVGADGRVSRVEVLRSSGHSLLDAAARDSIQRWQFSPARRAAGVIASTIEVPIEFKLND